MLSDISVAISICALIISLVAVVVSIVTAVIYKKQLDVTRDQLAVMVKQYNIDKEPYTPTIVRLDGINSSLQAIRKAIYDHSNRKHDTDNTKDY